MRAYKEENPDKEVISLGIGDVTQPLVPAIIDARSRGSRGDGSRSRLFTVMRQIWGMNF